MPVLGARFLRCRRRLDHRATVQKHTAGRRVLNRAKSQVEACKSLLTWNIGIFHDATAGKPRKPASHVLLVAKSTPRGTKKQIIQKISIKLNFFILKTLILMILDHIPENPTSRSL